MQQTTRRIRGVVAGVVACGAVAAVALIAACGGGRDAEMGAPPPSGRYDIGRAATAAEIAVMDIDVGPDGVELPAGQGTVSQGAKLFGAQCASCHGVKGEGMPPAYPKLVGREPREGFPFGRDPKLEKTIGNYWPYATTLFDYVRRAMPYNAPLSLTDEEVYAATAYVLFLNRIIGETDVINAQSLPAVKMPNRDAFINAYTPR